MSELTKSERRQLKIAEDIIEKGLSTFLDVGSALKTIRDNYLHRGTHDTFEKYVKDRWDMSRPRAYQFIDAAEVEQDLSTIVDKLQKPSNERQYRELVQVPQEKLEEVVVKANEIADRDERPITAKDFKTAREQVVEPGKTAPPRREEPAPEPKPEAWKIERSKGMKTAAALQRSVDELNDLRPNAEYHRVAMEFATNALVLLRDWK